MIKRYIPIMFPVLIKKVFEVKWVALEYSSIRVPDESYNLKYTVGRIGSGELICPVDVIKIGSIISIVL
jgi:hypothetical protein